MIHHCLGLCHRCQLAHLPSLLSSSAPFRDAWREAIMLVSHEQMVRPCWDPSAGGRVDDVSVEGTIMAVGGGGEAGGNRV